MMNTVKKLMIAATLLVFAVPAYSGSATQIFLCEQVGDTTDEQVDEIASAWLKAAKGMKGGENLQAYLRFPVAANVGEHDFAFVLITPSFEEWGAFTDAYEGSPAEEIDKKFDEMADCGKSTLWESFPVK